MRRVDNHVRASKMGLENVIENGVKEKGIARNCCGMRRKVRRLATSVSGQSHTPDAIHRQRTSEAGFEEPRLQKAPMSRDHEVPRGFTLILSPSQVAKRYPPLPDLKPP